MLPYAKESASYMPQLLGNAKGEKPGLRKMPDRSFRYFQPAPAGKSYAAGPGIHNRFYKVQRQPENNGPEPWPQLPYRS